jgi:hypothetical protein
MADGLDPIQQFIQNHMSFQQFMEGQRQFGAQVELQRRQAENQEMQQFAALVPFVQQPEQRESLAQYFATRNPEMADTFAALARSIPVSTQVYESQLAAAGMGTPGLAEGTASRLFAGQDQGSLAQSRAMAGRSLEDLTEGLRTAEGLELTAGQREQVNQFIQSFFEGQRQFDIDAAQRDRQLGIAEFEAAQRGELGRLQTMFGAGFGGHVLRAEHSQQLLEVDQALNNQRLTPEQRRGLETRKLELENAIRQMDNWIAAQVGGGAGQGGLGGMNLNQIVDAEETAFDQILNASSPGEKNVAIERFNFLRSLLTQGGMPGSMLQQDQSFLQRLFGKPGSTVVTEPVLTTPPFIPTQR